ncbi:MAG TPA: hypothetical protein EYF98_16265 [Planctomycetes bacterium]|nr:hypothetical protein [Planctomycetota bacterium]
MQPEVPTPSHPEPGEVLSLAEAAAWVGVGHLALRTGLDVAEVQLLAGMRGGRALRLVRVCDLRAAFPAVGHKPSPGAEWFTEVRPEEEVPGALLAGLSRLRPAAGDRPAPFIKPTDQDFAPQEAQGTDEPASRETSRYLRQQLDRTRAEVTVTKEENSRLKHELLSSADAVKKWLDCVRDDAVKAAPPTLETEGLEAAPPTLETEGVEVDSPRPSVAPVTRQSLPPARHKALESASWQHRFSLVVGVVLVLVGLIGGSGIVGGLGWGKRGPASERHDAPEQQAQMVVTRSDQSQTDAPAGGGKVVTVPQSTDREPEPLEEAEWQGPSDMALIALFNAGILDVEPSTDPEVAAPEETPAPPLVAVRSAPPMMVAPGSAILAAPLAQSGEQGAGESCLYFALTRSGMEGRELIGPCQGVWSPRLGAVMASHHRDDHWSCRGHDHFDRTLDGSMVRAREMAMVAKAEGLLSPLLSLRVERSAASMLREEIPVWIQSGFESGLLGVGHIVEPMATADHWMVHSWVRYLDFAGVENQRRFRLSLALGDGPRGDFLLSLQWEEE